MEETRYRERIIELYEEGLNFRKLKNKTHTLKHKNPVCKDNITIELEIKNNRIINAGFYGISCFVSTVSASALIKNIKGMKLEEAKKLTKKDLDKFLGVKITPGRIKCELLPLEALKKIKNV